MKLLALDLSTTSTGYAVFVNGELESSGTIAPKKSLPVENRIKHILSAIEVYFNAELKPDRVISEAPILYGGHIKGIFSLGNLHGGLMLLCSQNEIDLKQINNMVWKKHIAGGNATKEQTQDFLRRVRGIKTETTDESDAIGIGLGWMAEQRYKDKIGKYTPEKKKRGKAK